MRYHLWFAPPSRRGPHGVRDSGAVTGAARPVPYFAKAVRAAAPRGIHKGPSPPFHRTGGSLDRVYLATGPFPHSVPTLSQFFAFVKGLPASAAVLCKFRDSSCFAKIHLNIFMIFLDLCKI